MATTSHGLNLDPNGVAFAVACCFVTRNRPAHIDEFMVAGEVFAAVNKKRRDWYRYIWRQPEQSE
jgi:hypothetical protein